MTDPTIERLRAERDAYDKASAEYHAAHAEYLKLRYALEAARGSAEKDRLVSDIASVSDETKIKHWNALWGFIVKRRGDFTDDKFSLAVAWDDPPMVDVAWDSPSEFQSWLETLEETNDSET